MLDSITAAPRLAGSRPFLRRRDAHERRTCSARISPLVSERAPAPLQVEHSSPESRTHTRRQLSPCVRPIAAMAGSRRRRSQGRTLRERRCLRPVREATAGGRLRREGRTANRQGLRRSSPCRMRPDSSIARSTGYSPAKPPGQPSATTASLVSTPCRCSKTPASAWSRSVADAPAPDQLRDQRPPARRARLRQPRKAWPTGGRRAAGPSRRSGANVSFVTSPDQTRSQSASSIASSSPPPHAP